MESLRELEKLDWNEPGMKQAAKTYRKIKNQEIESLITLSDEVRRALLVRQF